MVIAAGTEVGAGHAVLRAMAAVGGAAAGTTVLVPAAHPGEVAAIDRWVRASGMSTLAVHAEAVEVYLGRLDDLTSVPAERMPGHRVWFYTNFHCNLACDYCCAESSPRVDPATLAADEISDLVVQAVAAGTREFFLTGGEPFLHPELDRIVADCAAAAPTVLLTNAMLLRGSRLALLRRMPREGLVLQVSLDSPTAAQHDRHRGAGSWDRAVAGISIAVAEGFTVRLAATLPTEEAGEEEALATLGRDLGVGSADIVVRRVARQGSATAGIAVTRATLVPEVCLSAHGVHWHPVAPLDPTLLVRRERSPLATAVAAIREEFLDYRRRGDLLAATFPCA